MVIDTTLRTNVDFEMSLQYLNTSREPVNLSTHSAFMQVRDTDKNLITQFDSTGANSGTITMTANGNITIFMHRSNCASLPRGTNYYDLVVLDTNDKTALVTSGRFEIIEGVTSV